MRVVRRDVQSGVPLAVPFELDVDVQAAVQEEVDGASATVDARERKRLADRRGRASAEVTRTVDEIVQRVDASQTGGTDEIERRPTLDEILRRLRLAVGEAAADQ